ncbi:hypothetical protein EVAR_48776_1 [Eumeta japonica]|uniref:Uncharacterized protein n=1 Tax=Eumeta variegata TaxID=151549 RepID=A0A4C1Y5D0_EUMVA|nr:hypothetical protein EVAR_48776_1 [Eumeta japonica]
MRAAFVAAEVALRQIARQILNGIRILDGNTFVRARLGSLTPSLCYVNITVCRKFTDEYSLSADPLENERTFTSSETRESCGCGVRSSPPAPRRRRPADITPEIRCLPDTGLILV